MDLQKVVGIRDALSTTIPHDFLGHGAYDAGVAVRRLLLARRCDGDCGNRAPHRAISAEGDRLHHRLRNIGALSEILEESSEDNLLQKLRSSSRAKALKSLRALLDSVLQYL